jgi:hypothetical protein
MKSFKIFAAVSAAAFAVSMIAAPASADSHKKGPTASILPSLLGPIGVAAAVGSTTTSLTWTTIATKTWTYPWTYKPFFGGNIIPQGINATGQYISNVINPHYFNETLHLTKPHNIFKPDVGEHSTSAQYKEKHQQGNKSRSHQGKIVVGCIMGSALGAITAAVRKGTAMGNPLRWRSQAEHEMIVKSGYEKQFELTNGEAATATALCGLGSLALNWQQAAPVVTARY